MSVARLTTIAGEIKTLIAAMTTTAGYHLNWNETGDINEPDAALPAGVVSVDIRYKSEAVADGFEVYGMANAEFTIEVIPKITPSATSKPKYVADSYCDSALADLKKLFLSNDTGYLPLSGEAVITYKSSSREELKRQNTFNPVRLITVWNVLYHSA